MCTCRPIPTISWHKDDVLLASGPNVIFNQFHRVLELHNVQPPDAGVYTCKSSQDQVTMINNITAAATLSVIGADCVCACACACVCLLHHIILL